MNPPFNTIILATVLALPFTALASTTTTPTGSAFVAPDTTPKQSVVSAFKQYLPISPTITVPAVLEVPLGLDVSALPVVAVFNVTTNQFEPRA
jgi:hypothetical protein